MHEFVVDHEAFERTGLHHWNPAATDRNTVVFEAFETDAEVYEVALAETERILSYELFQLPGDSFFTVVDERLDTAGTRQTAAVTRGGPAVVPPVIFDDDRTISMTFVGVDEALQPAVGRLPEGHGLRIVRVRECTGPGSVSVKSLSPRQHRAVETVVDCGYYHKPWTRAAAGMATRLDCSAGVVTEHLRKAEMKVMADLVGRS